MTRKIVMVTKMCIVDEWELECSMSRMGVESMRFEEKVMGPVKRMEGVVARIMVQMGEIAFGVVVEVNDGVEDGDDVDRVFVGKFVGRVVGVIRMERGSLWARSGT